MEKSIYPHLPTPLSGGPTKPFIPNIAIAKAVETGLPNDQYYTYLTTGGTGLPSGVPDTRLPNVTNLPDGPFQLTPGIPYDAYAASPVHRFYQMWQQLDCNINYSDVRNPSGCATDLSLGLASPPVPTPTALLHQLLSPRPVPAKAEPPWGSTTSSKATRPT